MRKLKSLILHEKYRKSYKKYGGLQCLPNVCPMSAPCPQFLLNVHNAMSPISAQCPQFLPNVVCGQISDFFRYVPYQTSKKNVLKCEKNLFLPKDNFFYFKFAIIEKTNSACISAEIMSCCLSCQQNLFIFFICCNMYIVHILPSCNMKIV